MIEIRLDGSDQVVVNALRNKADTINAKLMERLNALDLKLQAYIVGQKLHGQMVNQHSGKLAGSIRAIPATQEGSTIVGQVLGGGGVAPYGVFIHDGTKGPYPIVAVNAKALAFMLEGNLRFFKSVMHPGLKARSFMTSSLEEMTPDIVSGLQDALNEAISA